MEEVAGDAEYESELETELVTADASYHLHKIVHTVIQIEEMGNLELTNRSSTWCLDSSSNGQGAWHETRYGSTVRRLQEPTKIIKIN